MESFLMLRGFIVGILFFVSVECLVFLGWNCIGRGFKQVDTGWVTDSAIPSYTASVDYFSKGIKQSVEELASETERIAMPQIIDELAVKDFREIMQIKLSRDVCKKISCRGVSSETVIHDFDAYSEARVAEQSHEIASRNAWIETASVGIALCSLL
jgi:hypothetical protein